MNDSEFASVEEWHELRVEVEDEQSFDVRDKYVVIEFDSGETYAVVADIIAQDRAASVDLPEDVASDDSEGVREFYEEERNRTRDDDELLVEWAQEKMDWKELERASVRIFRSERPLSERLSEAEMTVRSLDE